MDGMFLGPRHLGYGVDMYGTASCCHEALRMLSCPDPHQNHIRVPDQDALLSVPHSMGNFLRHADVFADSSARVTYGQFVSGV